MTPDRVFPKTATFLLDITARNIHFSVARLPFCAANSFNWQFYLNYAA